MVGLPLYDQANLKLFPPRWSHLWGELPSVMKHDSFNESAEMYMKTIAELAAAGTPVPISALAGRLGVSAVSATEMIHRLEHNGLIAHYPYKGVALTDPGRRQAVEVIRSHRLWECFLTDHLGISWQAAHDLACRLEHATDAVVTDALEVYLGHPATCPHGNPIPRPDGAANLPADVALAAVRPECTVVISRIHPETDELLAYLAELGLVLGKRVTVRECLPFHGPLVLLLDGDARYVGLEAASRVYVYPVEETV